MGAGTRRWWVEEEAFEMRARRETLRLLSDWNSRNYARHRYDVAWDHSSLSRECEALFSAIDGARKPPPVFGAGSFEHWKTGPALEEQMLEDARKLLGGPERMQFVAGCRHWPADTVLLTQTPGDIHCALCEEAEAELERTLRPVEKFDYGKIFYCDKSLLGAGASPAEPRLNGVTIAGVKFTAPEPPPMTAVEAARLDSEIAMGLISQAFRDAKPTVAGRIDLAQRWLAEGRIDSEEYVKILEAPPNEPLGLKWVGYRFVDNNFEEKDMASLRDVTMTLEEFRARFRREPEAPGPDEHCCICNRKMPRVLGQDPTRFRRDGEPVLLVNDAGWMKVFFPWKWPDPGSTLPEHSNVCPPCAERVAGYIAHLKKPALDDNDL